MTKNAWMEIAMHHSVALTEAPKNMVYSHVKDRLEKTDTHVKFTPDDVYVVWFCKTLQNWKALVSTTLPDGMYYEVTFDGDRQQIYIDSYKKFENLAFDYEDYQLTPAGEEDPGDPDIDNAFALDAEGYGIPPTVVLGAE